MHRDVIVKCLDYFPDTDFSTYVVIRDDNSECRCWIDYVDRIISMCQDYWSIRDFEFAMIHEMRHEVQHVTGLCRMSHDMFSQSWHDGFTVTGWEMKYDTNHQKYVRYPWEADANNFAHDTMGGYIPEHPSMWNIAESLIERQHVIRVSSHNEHRASA